MRKAVNKLMKGVSLIMGFLLIMAVIMVFVEVVARYVLHSPIGWSDQLCRFLYVWIIMLGMPILFHEKSATAFDFLSSKMDKKKQDALYVFVCLLIIAFSVCFFYFSWAFMMKKGGQTIPSFGGIPFYAVYGAMPLSCVLIAVEMLMQLAETVKTICREKGEKK